MTITGGPEPSRRRDDPLRVMIVDDSAVFRGAARALIEACVGLTVSGEAGSGEEALASLRSCRPDMVLLDVHLPGIDGPETCRRLQADDPHLGILLVSSDDHDPSASSDCRPTAFLRKSELSPRRLTACLAAMRR